MLARMVQSGTFRAWMARRRKEIPGREASMRAAVSSSVQRCTMDEKALTKLDDLVPSKYSSEPICIARARQLLWKLGRSRASPSAQATKANKVPATRARVTYIGRIRLQQRVIQLDQSYLRVTKDGTALLRVHRHAAGEEL